MLRLQSGCTAASATLARRSVVVATSPAVSSTSYKTCLPSEQTRGIRSIVPRIARRNNMFRSNVQADEMAQVLDGWAAQVPEVELKSGQVFRYRQKLIRDTQPRRPGLTAVKKGMTTIYETLEDGSVRMHPVTLLQVDRAQVVVHKTPKTVGYYGVEVGSGSKNALNVKNPKAMINMYRSRSFQCTVDIPNVVEDAEGNKVVGEGFRKVNYTQQGLPFKKSIRCYRVRDKESLLPVGAMLNPAYFDVGSRVDVRSVTKSKGFAGVIKRWGFKGQSASHGTSLTHRSPGSIGGGQGSGSRVYPGKKMPGKMGEKNHVVRALRVMTIDDDMGIIGIRGAVPGPKGREVEIRDSLLDKPWPRATSCIEGVHYKLPGPTSSVLKRALQEHIVPLGKEAVEAFRKYYAAEFERMDVEKIEAKIASDTRRGDRVLGPLSRSKLYQDYKLPEYEQKDRRLFGVSKEDSESGKGPKVEAHHPDILAAKRKWKGKFWHKRFGGVPMRI